MKRLSPFVKKKFTMAFTQLYCNSRLYFKICSNNPWRVWVRRGGCIGSWWGNRRERDHWGDLGVDGWIILEWVSVGVWTVLGCFRIETGGGRL